MDTNANGLLTKRELISYLNQFTQSFNYDCLRRIIQWYDKNRHMRLNYNDFSSFILPHSIEEDNGYQYIDYQPNQIGNELFIKLIDKELEIAKRLGEIAETIKETKGFVTYEAFLLIVGEDKFITQHNLKQYFNHQGIVYNSISEITQIIYRYSQDLDGNIRYEEFKNIFFPYLNKSRQQSSSFDPCPKALIDSSMNNEEQKLNEGKEQLKHQQLLQSKWLNFDYSLKPDSKGIENTYLNTKETYDKMLSTNISKQNQYKDVLTYDNYRHIYTITNTHQQKNNSLDNIPIHSTMNNNTTHNLLLNSPGKNQLAFFNSSPYKEFSNNNSNHRTTHKSSTSFSLTKSIQEKKKYFIDLIKEILQSELLCESIREKISRNPLMNLPDIFCYFDYSNRDHISVNDLKEVLHNLSITVSIDEIELLFKRYDKDYDRYLDYSDFCMMILHKKIEFAKMLSNHQPSDNFSGFNESELGLLSELFSALIKCEKSCEEKKRIMASYPGYSNFEVFEMIKARHSDLIYKSDVSYYY